MSVDAETHTQRGVSSVNVVVLGTHLARDQAGAAHATIDIINGLTASGWATVTVFAYSLEPGAVDSRAIVIEGRRLPEPPLLWRIPSAYAVAKAVKELADAHVPEAEVCYTQNTVLGLAYRKRFPRARVISHTGHVIAHREFLEESGASTLQHQISAFFIDRLEQRAYAARRWTHVVSTRLVATQREKHYGLPPGFFAVQPLGVDLRRFNRGAETPAQVRSALGVAADRFVVATVARLVRWKNIDLLIRAIAGSRSRPVLVVLGEGPEREALQRLTHQVGIADLVHFVGHAFPAPYLAAANIFVLPSAIESFGMVYAEAMLMGLPCIGLRNDPPRVLSSAEDVIPSGRAGYCVSSEDELRARIDEMAVNPTLVRQLGDEAHRLASMQYSVGRYCEFLHGLITTVSHERA